MNVNRIWAIVFAIMGGVFVLVHGYAGAATAGLFCLVHCATMISDEIRKLNQ